MVLCHLATTDIDLKWLNDDIGHVDVMNLSLVQYKQFSKPFDMSYT